VIRRLTKLLSIRDRPLRDRLAVLIGAAVASAVALTGTAAYVITGYNVYTQLDAELVDVAAVTSNWITGDLESMGGLDTNALQAANVSVMLVRSDNKTTSLPGEQVVLLPGVNELAIARKQQGYSARSGLASNGARFRIVAVPLSDGRSSYALVLGRPLAPTDGILSSLMLSLLVFGVLGVVVAVGLGWLIARSGIQPVVTLTEEVSRITETDDLTPIAIRGVDEISDLTRAFNTLLATLESSRERQKRLIADAGHELRTPLTSMRTNVELLVADERQGMLPPGSRSDILRDIAAQLGEFTTLVGDLVLLSREDAVQPHPEPIDLRDVINSALARAKRRGPGLSFDVELSPLFLVGEPDSLERAITNLLDNAVKFSPPGGTVRVVLEGDRLRISDQGPGIAEEDLAKVFDRFYRSADARNTPGSGLGLSIVAQTIKAHGGWVKAGRSAEGGAMFTVRLPGRNTPPGGSDDSFGDNDATIVLPRIR
jgi:two-component system sensor histidine kinase MprB